jgi:hypothetical protein
MLGRGERIGVCQQVCVLKEERALAQETGALTKGREVTPKRGRTGTHTARHTRPQPRGRNQPRLSDPDAKVCVGILAPHTPTPKGCEGIY